MFSQGKSPRRKLFLALVFTLVAVLLVGAGYVGYQVKTDLNKVIYKTPRGKIGERDPEDLGLAYQPVEFTADKDLRIRGWFIDSNSKDCIIFVSGKGRTRWDFLDLVPSLHRAGYDLLLFDPRGTGKSEGKKWGFGYLESRDILDAIDFLEESFGDRQFGLLGASSGATASLMAALEDPDIAAVVADSPFCSIKLASETYGDYKNRPFFDLVFPLYLFGINQMIGADVAEKTNLKQRIEDLRTAVLFIHGTADQLISPKNTEILYANKPGEKELWTPVGVGHVGSFEALPEEYKDKLIDFFGAHL